ncbi:MAG: PrsW family intramembrane metalloprotease [Phycisphaerales bacterium]|nr:PrsW family intramembrane metalloprotease [Phycisphaerales bacterium]
MGVATLYITLAICGVFCVWLIRRYDLHDREPWWAVLVAIAFGAGMMFLAGKAQVWVLSQGGHWVASNFNLSMAVCAGTIEEICKALVVLGIALVFGRVFNDPLDGLIFGALAGLGAAMEESVVYLMAGAKSGMLPGTEPVRLLGHLVMGGISCFGFGCLASGVARAERLAWWWLPIGMGVGIGLHVVWDIVAFDVGDRGAMSTGHTIASIAMMLFGFVAFGLLVVVGQRRSAGVFARADSVVAGA